MNTRVYKNNKLLYSYCILLTHTNHSEHVLYLSLLCICEHFHCHQHFPITHRVAHSMHHAYNALYIPLYLVVTPLLLLLLLLLLPPTDSQQLSAAPPHYELKSDQYYSYLGSGREEVIISTRPIVSPVIFVAILCSLRKPSQY
jgi:hypothetical protein